MPEEITPQKQLKALSNLGVQNKQQFIATVLTDKPTAVYSPGDYNTIRGLLYDNVSKAIQSRFPLTNDRYTLGVQNLKYDGPEDFTLDEQKQAILENKSLGRRLRGQWVLRDTATGKEQSRTGMQTLLRVPYITDRGTFIRSGSQYTFNNIMRLEPGVYTKRNNDRQVSAQFNVRRGTGAGFNMKFAADTGLFYLSRGTKNVPAYTVLQQMGVTDDQMTSMWGKELMQMNKKVGSTTRAKAAAQTIYKG